MDRNSALMIRVVRRLSTAEMLNVTDTEDAVCVTYFEDGEIDRLNICYFCRKTWVPGLSLARLRARLPRVKVSKVHLPKVR